MFGGVNVWRIAELKVIGEIKFGEWIDFVHKDTIYQPLHGTLNCFKHLISMDDKLIRKTTKIMSFENLNTYHMRFQL